MAFPELVIQRFVNTNAPGGLGKEANTTWSPPAVETSDPAVRQGYLASDELGEVLGAVAYAPVTDQGVAEGTLGIDLMLVLDGVEYPYIHALVDQSHLMLPTEDSLMRGTPIAFGTPILGRNGKTAGQLDGTGPKFTKRVSVRVTPLAAVTQDYTVDLITAVYPKTLLAEKMRVYRGPAVRVPDPLNGRDFVVKERVVAPAGGDWTKAWPTLMGGLKQTVGGGQTAIHKLVRWASNQNPTQANTAYQFMYENSASSPGVEFDWQNLFFNLDSDQAIIAERLGVVGPLPTAAGAEVLSAAIYTSGESQKRHPEGGIPAGYYRGRIPFGLAPGRTNRFLGVPRLPQGEQLLTAERTYVGVVDNGQSLVAQSIYAAFIGTLVEAGAGGVI